MTLNGFVLTMASALIALGRPVTAGAAGIETPVAILGIVGAVVLVVLAAGAIVALVRRRRRHHRRQEAREARREAMESGLVAAATPPVTSPFGTPSWDPDVSVTLEVIARRVRNLVDRAVQAQGLPAYATTLVTLLGDRRGADAEPDTPPVTGFIALASDDRAGQAFRNWFEVEGGAVPKLRVRASGDLRRIVDELGLAVVREVQRAGPLVPADAALTPVDDALADLARRLESELAGFDPIPASDDLESAIVCVTVVAPSPAAGTHPPPVRFATVALAQRNDRNGTMAREVAVSAVLEAPDATSGALLPRRPPPELPAG